MRTENDEESDGLLRQPCNHSFLPRNVRIRDKLEAVLGNILAKLLKRITPLASLALGLVLAWPLVEYLSRRASSSESVPHLNHGLLSIALHPERHALRQPMTLTFDWNIRLEKRAPDGVEKAVYLVNGMKGVHTLAI